MKPVIIVYSSNLMSTYTASFLAWTIKGCGIDTRCIQFEGGEAKLSNSVYDEVLIKPKDLQADYIFIDPVLNNNWQAYLNAVVGTNPYMLLGTLDNIKEDLAEFESATSFIKQSDSLLKDLLSTDTLQYLVSSLNLSGDTKKLFVGRIQSAMKELAKVAKDSDKLQDTTLKFSAYNVMYQALSAKTLVNLYTQEYINNLVEIPSKVTLQGAINTQYFSDLSFIEFKASSLLQDSRRFTLNINGSPTICRLVESHKFAKNIAESFYEKNPDKTNEVILVVYLTGYKVFISVYSPTGRARLVSNAINGETARGSENVSYTNVNMPNLETIKSVFNTLNESEGD